MQALQEIEETLEESYMAAEARCQDPAPGNLSPCVKTGECAGYCALGDLQDHYDGRLHVSEK